MMLRASLRILFAALLGLLFLPLFTHAAMSAAANAMCTPWIPACPCNTIPDGKGGCTGGKNTANCPPGVCVDHPPGGTVPGICVAAMKCEGTSFTGQNGQSQGIGDLKGMMDAIKGIMDALKGGGGGGGGGGEQPPQGQQGCTSTYQVTAPSSDPCAVYVPPTSDSLLGSGLGGNSSSALLDALGSGSALNVTGQLSDVLGAPNQSNTQQTQTPQSSTQTTPSSNTTNTTNTTQNSSVTNLGGQAVNLQAGTQGNIEVTSSGATVIARARDTGANTEVAGFFGSTISGNEQPQGLAAGLCKNRPWSSSIVTYLIPPTFFDSLCAWRGYQVGTPQPVVSVPVVQTQQPASVASQPVVSTVAPEVDIWAVPARVALGTRTSVFWNTKGVDTCTISSPEGNFEEHTLSGGAATVPLSGPTTFTISCVAPDGTPITDYVTVDLAI